jgi:dTDP-4-dehydrorhamnose reductase
VTEAHNGCTREEQLRWLDEVWHGAEAARAAGADVRAVTVWSLLGAYDWHTLVTRDEGVYEPGVFDLRSRAPRPTALVPMVRDLATAGRHAHPVLEAPGWWRRPDRFIYGHVVAANRIAPARRMDEQGSSSARPIVLVGASSAVGRALVGVCRDRGLLARSLERSGLNLRDAKAVDEALAVDEPWAVIDATAYGSVSTARGARALALSDTPEASAVLAADCARRGIPLVTFSSALVFAGDRGEPRAESDVVAPLGPEGEFLAAVERAVLAVHSAALVLRTGPPFGTDDSEDVVEAALRLVATGRPVGPSPETVVSLTYVPDLAQAALDLLIDGECGIWHLPNRGTATWGEIARKAATRGEPYRGADRRPTGRPTAPALSAYGLLRSERGWIMPSLKDALVRYAAGATVRVAA